jgi:transposase
MKETVSMAYSIDLRKRVVNFVRNKQGTQLAAANLFKISLWCVKQWLKRPELKASKPGPTAPTKLSTQKLEQALDQTPDATLAEHAQKLGVSLTTVFYACKRNKITRKKNHTLPRTR